MSRRGPCKNSILSKICILKSSSAGRRIEVPEGVDLLGAYVNSEQKLISKNSLNGCSFSAIRKNNIHMKTIAGQYDFLTDNSNYDVPENQIALV